jgi:hypothetical protein
MPWILLNLIQPIPKLFVKGIGEGFTGNPFIKRQNFLQLPR